MKALIKVIDKMSSVGGYAAGCMTVLGLAIVIAEIFLRSLFSSTLYITEEYSGYLMCGISFCGLAYTLSKNGHIRMVFLHKILSTKPRLYLEIGCSMAGFVVCILITYSTAYLFCDSYETRSQSMQITETYLAIPQFFMPLGSLLISLQFLANVMKGFLTFKGDLASSGLIDVDNNLGR